MMKSYIKNDGTLNDEKIIADLHKAAKMYEDGEILESGDLLSEIVDAIKNFCNN